MGEALDPFWTALSLDVTAEATRDEALGTILRDADARIRQMIARTLARDVPPDEADARIKLFLAIVQGLGLKLVRNPDLPRKEVAGLVRLAVRSLFTDDAVRASEAFDKVSVSHHERTSR